MLPKIAYSCDYELNMALPRKSSLQVLTTVGDSRDTNNAKCAVFFSWYIKQAKLLLRFKKRLMDFCAQTTFSSHALQLNVSFYPHCKINFAAYIITNS